MFGRHFIKTACFILLVSNGCIAEAGEGVRFTDGLNWQQVLQKAQLENKFIFVDCIATWCGPCKSMEELTYSTKEIGDFVNEHFVAIKVQMDSTKLDNEQVKSWYKEARLMTKQYMINSLPTFLFFSPDGKIVHKGVDYMEADEFIGVLKNALDPKRQYYSLLAEYNEGKPIYSSMPYLVGLAQRFGDKKLAEQLSEDYRNYYLYRLTDKDLCTKDNIEFLGSAIQSSKERGFQLFYEQPALVDRLLKKKGYAEYLVDNIIFKEDIRPKLWRGDTPLTDNPDWNTILKAVLAGYDTACAQRVLLRVKIKWYGSKHDWPAVGKYCLQQLETDGLDTAEVGLKKSNDMIWNIIFMHIENKEDLSTALFWEAKIVEKLPNDGDITDTYANLLYKLGNTKSAVEWEEKAISLFPLSQELKTHLAKMKLGEPTWPKQSVSDPN